MAPLDLRLGWYCSPSMRLGAVVSLLTGIAIATVNIYIGVILVLISVVMITTHYRLGINFDKQTYYDYVWFLGLKNGEEGKFESIQYVFITRNKVSQTLSSRVSQTSFAYHQFDGYLKLSEQVKIHLRSDDNKKRLTNAMQHLSLKLKCELVDYSLDP